MDSDPPSTGEVVAELMVTVALPSAVLMLGSGEARLGPLWGLVVALSMPLIWGVIGAVRQGSVSGLAVIAFVSIALTGGVGLLELEARWIAIKEAAVPLIMGLAVIATATTRLSVVPILFERLMDAERVEQALEAQGTAERHRALTTRASRWVGLLFLGSSILTYALARFMVTSQAGTAPFNEELGRFTVLSVPAVAVPVMLGMLRVLWGVVDGLEAHTGLDFEELIRKRRDR